jgi:hypothetical protein
MCGQVGILFGRKRRGLEGFRPNGHSLYRRVLVAVRCAVGIVPAWTYDGTDLTTHGTRAFDWPEEKPRSDGQTTNRAR